MNLSSALEKHVLELCKYIRTPRSTGYFKSQDYLRECIAKNGLQAFEQSFNVFRLGECKNIYCEIGDESKPRILLGAHYESRIESGVAADDNASACAILLELIPLLKQISSLSFTIVFFDMEENYGWSSLRGSRAFARAYKKPLSKVVILDLVGGSLAPHFEKTFLQFGPAFPTLKHSEYEFLHLPMKIVEPMGALWIFGARSDYDEYRKRGIPFLFISSGTPWYYHTEHDTPEILSYEKMNALTQSLFEELKKGDQPALEKHGRIEDMHRFLKKFTLTPILKTPRLEKLTQKVQDVSRYQIIRMYAEILPRLRKAGRSLWN